MAVISNAAAKVINAAEGIVVDGHDVAGGYFVIDSINNIPSYTNVTGALCYCTGDSKFYQYTGSSWQIKEFGTTKNATTQSSGLMSATDKTNLDTLVSLLDNDDANTTINTIQEVLDVFASYPEETTIVNSLAGKVDKETGKGLSANDFTKTYKDKLDGIASGAEVNVQSDWNATSGDAFIKNKPSLATVATTGNYNDLSNKPDIPTKTSDLENDSGFTTFNGYTSTNKLSTSYISGLATVATSGKYADLTGKPTYNSSTSTLSISTLNINTSGSIIIGDEYTIKYTSNALAISHGNGTGKLLYNNKNLQIEILDWTA